MTSPDAIVVGAGPNGLAAAIVLAQAGWRVLVLERGAAPGGGCRSDALTLPGFTHDVCSAVHPFAAGSPFFRSLPLTAHGLEWIHPPVMLAHPLDGDRAVCLYGSLQRTADGLGPDRDRYHSLAAPIARDWPRIEANVLGPLRLPRHPLALARFGVHALRSAKRLAGSFREASTRALVGGLAAHAMMPLDHLPTAGVALTLALMAHIAGWPFPRGGAQALVTALVAHLRSLGGELATGTGVRSIDDLPPARAVLCDLSPAPLLRIAGHRFPPRYRRALERYRYGMAAYKIDWALNGPIPWSAPECASAGTLHLGGTFEEIASSEREVWEGRHPQRPFVLVAQPTLFDPSRAPGGKHVAWGYCHVPRGSTVEMVDRVEAQIERFAPGFRDRVIARHVVRPADLEEHNPNYVGGDIAAGVMDLRQLFTRPTWRTYSTPVHGLFICSASTPPGVGVHGMCGYFAARRVLSELSPSTHRWYT